MIYIKMSWQDYVDKQLLASRCVTKAAIAGHDGNVWAKSEGFDVSRRWCARASVHELSLSRAYQRSTGAQAESPNGVILMLFCGVVESEAYDGEFGFGLLNSYNSSLEVRAGQNGFLIRVQAAAHLMPVLHSVGLRVRRVVHSDESVHEETSAPWRDTYPLFTFLLCDFFKFESVSKFGHIHNETISTSVSFP